MSDNALNADARRTIALKYLFSGIDAEACSPFLWGHAQTNYLMKKLTILALIITSLSITGCEKADGTLENPETVTIVGKWKIEKITFKSYSLNGTLLSTVDDTDEATHVEFTANNTVKFYYPTFTDNGSFILDSITQTVKISGTKEDEYNYKFKFSDPTPTGFTITTDETILDNNNTEKLVIILTLKK